MPFGLTNAPATFQAYINQALYSLVDICYVVYLDDILIFSVNNDQHIGHLRQIFERLRQFALYASMKKCEFFVPELEYLGFRIGKYGIRMDPERVKTITAWP